MREKVIAGFIILALILFSSSQGEENHYMELGIGVNNVSKYKNSPLDAARYDWSIIDMGNFSQNQETLAFLNKILEINPRHKFLLRVWPINQLGKNPNNRNMMTIFDYFYRKGIKDKALQETREQIAFFMKGLSNPEKIAALCFLEELPLHISSYPWYRWKKGDPIPWDLKAFSAEIEKDLGAPFDMMNPEHRLWWGKKYAEMVNEFHSEMKKASGGRKIFYWHVSSMAGTLDNLQAGEQMINQFGQSPIPIHYKEIVKPGLCDGIFGYPGCKMEERCISQAKELNCLYFLQVSTPAFMRSIKLDKAMDSAMNKDRHNVGIVMHDEQERGIGLWNQLEWTKDKECTHFTNARMFGYLYKIGMPVLKKELKPEIKFDYNISGLKKGDFARVFVQIFNPVSPSWYGENADEATFKNIQMTLTVPEGFEVPPANNSKMPLNIGDMKPYEAKLKDWWVRKTTDSTIENPCFKAIVTWVGGQTVAASKDIDEKIDSFQPHYVIKNEEKWIEAAYRTTSIMPRVQICTLSQSLIAPELTSDHYSIKYNDILEPNKILTIGPGLKAILATKPLFDQNILTFGSDRQEGAVYDKDYLVYHTPRVTVNPNEKYLFKLTGKAQNGGNCLVVISFTCGKEKKDMRLFENKFESDQKTLEAEVIVPDFGTQERISMLLNFYRLNKKGTVIYKNFAFESQEKTKDVTHNLKGSLRPLEKFFTVWQFKDDSKPNYKENPKAVIKFLNPEQKDESISSLPFF